MDINNNMLDKIVQWFNAPTNKELEQAIANWRNESKQNEEAFQQLLTVWQFSEKTKVLDQVPVQQSTDTFSLLLEENSLSRQKRTRIISWIRSAAAAAIISGVGYWAYTSQEVNYLEKNTLAVIDSVRLSDGSMIYVAANSSIKYPEKLKGGFRKVYLNKGEAFFKVAKDSSHPFIVQMHEASVKVLGTSFNINTEASSIVLSVKTGKVGFTPSKSSTQTILIKGSGLVFNKATGTISPFQTQNRNEEAWLTQQLVFEDAPLADVCKSLESHYNVKIIIKANVSDYKKLNVRFDNSSLTEVLEILEATYPITISKEGDSVIIKGIH
ncbi:fec operon regulator FecR [compost metagenome]